MQICLQSNAGNDFWLRGQHNNFITKSVKNYKDNF